MLIRGARAAATDSAEWLAVVRWSRLGQYKYMNQPMAPVRGSAPNPWLYRQSRSLLPTTCICVPIDQLSSRYAQNVSGRST